MGPSGRGSIRPEEEEVLTRAIAATGAAVHRTRVIPFTERFDRPPPALSGPVLCYGYGALVAAGRHLGWRPCGWDGAGLGLRAVVSSLGPLAWNAAATFHPLSDLRRLAEGLTTQVFVRPEAETKAFAGRLYDGMSMLRWLDGLDRADWAGTDDPLFAVAPVRPCRTEWRVWIVDGVPIAGCRYGLDGRADPAPDLPDRIAAFARRAVALHDPLPAYVLDVGEDAAGLGVIELNAVNSAGFYAADIGAIVAALTHHIRRSQ